MHKKKRRITTKKIELDDVPDGGDDSSQFQSVQARIPPGVRVGMNFKVKVPDAGLVDLVCPRGARPGTEIQCKVYNGQVVKGSVAVIQTLQGGSSPARNNVQRKEAAAEVEEWV